MASPPQRDLVPICLRAFPRRFSRNNARHEFNESDAAPLFFRED